MKGLTENAIANKLQENETVLPKKDIEKVINNCIASWIECFFSFLVIIEIGNKNNQDRKIVNTAIVYFRRLYTRYTSLSFVNGRVRFNQVHPYLAVPTTFYLASKVEETITSCSRILSYFETVCRNHKIEPVKWEVEDVLKCENVILDELQYSLLVYHPFRPLRHFLSLFHLEEYLQSCTYFSIRSVTHSNIINDSFYTTIPLLIPPHMIALTAIYMVCIYGNIDPSKAFSVMNVDMDSIQSVCSKMCMFYESSPEFWPSTLTDLIITLSQQFNHFVVCFSKIVWQMSYASQIDYSDRYYDETYEYRHWLDGLPHL